MPEPDIVFEGVPTINDKDTCRILRVFVCRDPGEIAVYDEDGVCGSEVWGVGASGEEGEPGIIRVREGDVDCAGAGDVDWDNEEAGEGGECGDRVGVSAEERGDDEW